jgi:hypothetical protein
MKRLLFLVALTIFSMPAFAQSDYERFSDAKTGDLIYKGKFTINDLYQEPSFGWMERGVSGYTPDSNAVKYLKKHLSQYNIIVVMGTWCEDSHNLVPKLYKTLVAASFPMQQYEMFGVDRDKKTKNIEHELYKIKFVPTIIVRKGPQEIGRIVESVKKNIETDLMHIIQDDIARKKG